MSAAAHLRFARAYTADKLPWFAPALFRCKIILSPSVDIAAIDRHYNVYWNPEIVNNIWAKNTREAALAELGFIWTHEISHRLREHAERAAIQKIAGKVPARLWNIAADFEINDAEWPGLQMPADYPGMLPQDFGLAKGELAETYYRAVAAKFPTELPNAPDDGSGVHNQAREWETGSDRQTISSLGDQVLRRETAQRIRQAGTTQLPESWRNWAAETLNPTVNWRQRLSHRMSVALQHGLGSRIDYSFQRPSRRQSVYHPILTPSLRGDQTARIAIVVDTSGSMHDELLRRALNEVAAVLRIFRYPITIIPCDMAAYPPVKVLAEAEAYQLKSLAGGGGTDMRAGIAAALDLQPRPDVVLVLTDGFTPYPTKRFDAPVIFGIFDLDQGVRRKPPNPPWREDTVVAINQL